MTEVTYEANLETIDEKLVLLRDSIPASIRASDYGSPSRVPFHAASARYTLLSRLENLTAAAETMLRSLEPVACAILTRANFETIAMLDRLEVTISSVEDSESNTEVLEKIGPMLFAGRRPESFLKATNILTLVNKMNKRIADVQSAYDRLSEWAHPNMDGLMRAYSSLDDTTMTLDLRLDRDASLVAMFSNDLALTLEIGLYLDGKIHKGFEAFRAVCHSRGPEPGLEKTRGSTGE